MPIKLNTIFHMISMYVNGLVNVDISTHKCSGYNIPIQLWLAGGYMIFIL